MIKVPCGGYTSEYCCTGGAGSTDCQSKKTFIDDGVEVYYWGCVLKDYFKGVAVTLSSGEVLYASGNIHPEDFYHGDFKQPKYCWSMNLIALVLFGICVPYTLLGTMHDLLCFPQRLVTP